MNNYSISSTDVSQYFKLTYLYMIMGIVVTGFSTFISAALVGQYVAQLFQSNWFFLILLVLQVGLALGVRGLAQSPNKMIAISGYLFFTIFEGVIISPFMIFASPTAIFAAFVSAAGLFGVMAIMGYTTKVDMSRFGGILLAATIAIIIASVVNLFLQSGMFNLIISVITILVFAVWTAYDNQHLRVAFESVEDEYANGIAVMGAFNLYLDFLNMFINLLSIFSNRD